MPRTQLYFLEKGDFSGNYDDDDKTDGLMDKDGGGRIKRSAFNRVFPTTVPGPDLRKEWACDDLGNPEG